MLTSNGGSNPSLATTQETAMSKKPKEVMYKQCVLRSPTEDGEMVQTAWIPAELSQVGKQVYFGKKTSTPDRLWTVSASSDPAISGEYLADHERDYMTQRAASDI